MEKQREIEMGKREKVHRDEEGEEEMWREREDKKKR